MPGAKKRIPLFDEAGNRIRGTENREAAIIALARHKLTWETQNAVGTSIDPSGWIVAKVCSEYIQYCEKALKQGAMSCSHRDNTVHWLNDLCSYCGAMQVAQLKKGHVTQWIESRGTWRSSETRRGVIAFVLAAFNRAQNMFDVPNPLKGLKKPRPKPRLTSISPEDEQALYAGCESRFREFLFAAIQTGLRPFCELARLTPRMVVNSSQGMLWKVYSSKTDKTRMIPVRQDVAERTRRIMCASKDGPIFRNRHGNPWKKPTAGGIFRALRRSLGWELDPAKSQYSCYSCRHRFAHRMLSGYWNEGAGCSIEVLAELLGDTPKVTFDHYGREWRQNYQEPLWAAIGVGPAVAAKTSRKSH